MGRNIANYSTFNSIIGNSIELQNNGTALTIYSDDPNDPIFSINPETRETIINGNFAVTGGGTIDVNIERAVLSTNNNNFTLNDTHGIVEFTFDGNVSVSLPKCNNDTKGDEYILIKTGPSTEIGNPGVSRVLTINAFAGDSIDNNVITSIGLSNQYDKVILASNGVNRWYTL
jgi:hypothetical protein